jgi:hypothetical protein
MIVVPRAKGFWNRLNDYRRTPLPPEGDAILAPCRRQNQTYFLAAC